MMALLSNRFSFKPVPHKKFGGLNEQKSLIRKIGSGAEDPSTLTHLATVFSESEVHRNLPLGGLGKRSLMSVII